VGSLGSDTLQVLSQQARQSWETALAGPLVPENRPPQNLAYRVLPSLLAHRLAGQAFDAPGHGRASWWLTQADDHWGLVSDLIPDTKSSHFAYFIEFVLHTVPYDVCPVLDLYIRCRRYVEEPLRGASLGKRATTVMLAADTRTPWLPNWPLRPQMLMIPLHLAWDYRTGQPYWKDKLPSLLKRYERTRQVIDVEILTNAPREGWRGVYVGRAPDDGYFTIYREGMAPNHGHETGFGSREQYLIWEQITSALSEILRPVATLDRDPQSVSWSRPLALRYAPELAGDDKQYVQVPVWEDGERRLRRLYPADRHIVMQQAWERNIGQQCAGSSPGMLFCYRTELLRDEVLAQIEHIVPQLELKVLAVKTPPELVAPLVDVTQCADKELSRAIQAARIARASQWQEYLTATNTGQVCLALIETPDPFGLQPEELSPKGAIRAGGAAAGLTTQMLISRQQKTSRGQIHEEELEQLRYRITGALGDLLLRHPPLLLGNFGDVYSALGLPADLATELTVIGLYHRRTQGLGFRRTMIRYPLAVRIKPDSTVELLRPGRSWQPYLTGTQALIRDAVAFRDTPGANSGLNLHEEDTCAFVQELVEQSIGPTLLLINAWDFRNSWKMLSNSNLQSGKLAFWRANTPVTDVLWDTPKTLPGLRVIRLLQNGETPTAVRVDDPAKYRDAEGLYRLPGPGELFLSYGRSPTRQDPGRLKIDRPRGFRRAQGLEIAPFFLQEGDDPAQWARLVHALRFTPNWERETLYPLPAHLAQAAIEDCLCLFEGDR